MTSLSDLRKLALAATPGPYVVNEMGNDDEGITRTVNTFSASRGREVAIITTGDFPDDQEARNADYIAALSPERVLAMIDCIEAAKILRKDYGSAMHAEGYKWISPTMSAFDAALAKVDQN